MCRGRKEGGVEGGKKRKSRLLIFPCFPPPPPPPPPHPPPLPAELLLLSSLSIDFENLKRKKISAQFELIADADRRRLIFGILFSSFLPSFATYTHARRRAYVRRLLRHLLLLLLLFVCSCKRTDGMTPFRVVLWSWQNNDPSIRQSTIPNQPTLQAVIGDS